MFTEKYSALSVPLSHGFPPISPKTTNKTSLLVEDLIVSGKASGSGLELPNRENQLFVCLHLLPPMSGEIHLGGNLSLHFMFMIE